MPVHSNLSYGPHGDRNLLDLYLPEGDGSPWPLVVCIHGGGWCGGDKSAMEWIGRSLAERGIAAASITYRFWPASPCPAAIDDTLAALQWLGAQAATFGLDRTRFGALGSSAGGHLAAYAALSGGDGDSCPALRCVVDCYGPVDLAAMMETASAPLVGGFMAMPLTAQSLAAYRAASPLYRVKPVPPPFLIVHGTKDVGTEHGQVPIDISERFCQVLQQAGGEATMLRIEGAPHGFVHNQQCPPSQAMWKAALPFLQRHLSGATTA